MIIQKYYIAAFLVKAVIKSNVYINFKKIKGGFPKCKHYIGNHHFKNCWIKYLYKK